MMPLVAGMGLSRSIIAVMSPLLPVMVQMFLMCCHAVPLNNNMRFYSLIPIYQISLTLPPSDPTVLSGLPGTCRKRQEMFLLPEQ